MRRAAHRELSFEDRPPGMPKQRWLYGQIRDGILTRRLGTGSRLPATRDLAAQYGLSRNTVTAVFEQLEAEGYVEGRVGRGTFVLAPVPDSLLQAQSQLPPGECHARRGSMSRRGYTLANSPFPLRPPATGSRPFRAGQPDVACFPIDLWTKTAARCFSRASHALLRDSEPAGYRPLREAIAAYLGAARGIRTSADQIAIICSVQQGLDLCARILLDPGDQAWVENPGYPGASQLLKAAGVRVVNVPVDSSGIDVGKALRLAGSAKLAFVTPVRQAPLGVPLSLERRIAILEWAKNARAWIFEDDYDGEYRFRGRPLAALKSLDRQDCVIYAGTFSKLLFPSLRLAYLVLPSCLVDSFAAALSLTARHVPTMMQAVLCDFIVEGHFGRHVRRMRTLYGERALQLEAAAREHLAGVLEVPPINAGLDVAARLLVELDDVELANNLARLHIEVQPLSRWTRGPARAHSSGLLLGFATSDLVSIRRGVIALSRVLNKATALLGPQRSLWADR